MRSISITTPSNSGIMRFAKKQLSCVGCKVPIRYFMVNILRKFSGILGSCKFYLILCFQSSLSFTSFVPLVSSLSDCICGIFLSSFLLLTSTSTGTLCARCKGREAELYCKNVSQGKLHIPLFLNKLLDPSLMF